VSTQFFQPLPMHGGIPQDRRQDRACDGAQFVNLAIQSQEPLPILHGQGRRAEFGFPLAITPIDDVPSAFLSRSEGLVRQLLDAGSGGRVSGHRAYRPAPTGAFCRAATSTQASLKVVRQRTGPSR
jgi:hypothetical protein